MEGLLYPASLVLLAVLAYTFYQTNNSMLVLIVVVIAAYIVYSNETGNTATNFKNDMVKSIDESVGNYSEERGIEGYDGDKIKEAVK